jgi:hypothetical protein
MDVAYVALAFGCWLLIVAMAAGCAKLGRAAQ